VTDDRRNYLVVGAFVLAMLAGLIAWLSVLAGRTGATDPYEIHFRNVLGLSESTEVLFDGYPVGLIESIEPVRDGEAGFRLRVALKRGWPIPEDSLAAVTASGLLAAVVIDIRSGESPRLLAPGDTIPSAQAASLFAVVSSVADEVKVLADRIRPVLDSLADGAPEIVGNLSEFSGDLNGLATRLDSVLSAENTGRISIILANLESTTTSFARAAADLNATRMRVDDLLVTVEGLLAENREEIGHAVSDLHDTLESVARHIDAINNDLEATARNLAEFSRQLREQPNLLIRGRESAGSAAGGG
jgi:phospholipid/cholesterol/gamma-HCH transport system substrate-binding protein